MKPSSGMSLTLAIGLLILVIALTVCAAVQGTGTPVQAPVSVIPQPSTLERLPGTFRLDRKSVIAVYPDTPEMRRLGAMLSGWLGNATGKTFPIVPGIKKRGRFIQLALGGMVSSGGEESYFLDISPRKIRIHASAAAGLFYGTQTLRQLLPIDGLDSAEPALPCLRITDCPRFGWRGLLLDCGRHFMTVDFIKQTLDLLSLYKMNRFHWHLTEDQGWRIEIKKYPRLTSVGAWREEADGTRYGGFYTQDDIREVVQYASDRFITVVPEIEMPGHSVAALASYPHLSCTGNISGVATQWGVFKDVYCAGNDSTFAFLQDVLDEVLALFPSPFIHIGGDECPKDRWKECQLCQARIRQEGLKDERELQSYFIRRIEKYLSSRGRRLIGWDEILEGGLAPNATVQSWRGMEGAVEAAQSGHDAIVSPTSHAYLDYDLGTTDLKKVYSFEPVPAELPPEEMHHILGGECNLWTEYAPQGAVHARLFPRMIAMAEVLWSPSAPREYEEFLGRVRAHYPRLERMGVHPGPESKPVTLSVAYTPEGKHKITLETGEEGLSMRYTLDGSEPARDSQLYTDAFLVGCSALVRARAFRGMYPCGEAVECTVMRHAALGRPLTLAHSFSPRYPGGGALGLTDGIRGSLNFRDGLWQGFEGNNFSAELDLGEAVTLNRISIGFLQVTSSWIFFPASLSISVSSDGVVFTKVAEDRLDSLWKNPKAMIRDFAVTLDRVQARHIRLVAESIGVCPEWHPGAGGKAWIFVDEIIVNGENP